MAGASRSRPSAEHLAPCPLSRQPCKSAVLPARLENPLAPRPEIADGFHHIGCISRGDIGDLVVSQFSHKSAYTAVTRSSDDTPKIKAIIYGAYTSHVDVHKRLVYKFVEVIDEDDKIPQN